MFNPENDLALANFSPNYTPPSAAVRMAADLALLPVWYAEAASAGRCARRLEDGASWPVVSRGGEIDAANGGNGNRSLCVIAPGEHNRSFYETVSRRFDLRARLIDEEDLTAFSRLSFFPWGWSPSLRRRFVSKGVSHDNLPSDNALTTIRDDSHRRHAVSLLSDLRLEMGNSGFCGEARYFTDMDSLLGFLDESDTDKVLKMPLSGSGKGLIRVLGGITDKQRDWCRRVIHSQGGVVAEPLLNRALDFAMEFFLDRGRVSFKGFSLFSTSSSGAYLGNELLGDCRIVHRLSDFLSPGLVYSARDWLMCRLPREFPSYVGYAGVDMMVCATENGYRMHPCVEVNMRMNMGIVARVLRDRFLAPEAKGRFAVDYFKTTEEIRRFHREMEKEYPLKVKSGKISSGYQALTPLTGDTRYLAYIVAG